MYVLESCGMSAACTWGLRGLFSDLCFFVISLCAASWVIHHYSPIRVPTLILRVFLVAARRSTFVGGVGGLQRLTH